MFPLSVRLPRFSFSRYSYTTSSSLSTASHGRFYTASVVNVAKDDDDVSEERELISHLHDHDFEAGDNLVVLQHLRKEYTIPPADRQFGKKSTEPKKYKIAVEDMCLHISKGEIFGMLGPNGAGKTTTIGMMVGDVIPSSGTAYIGGHNIMNELEETYALSGYCPQFDAFPDTLTASELLAMFAKIKGAPNKTAAVLTNEMIYKLGITQYKNQRTKGYSGGTKRKLSIAISLIAYPSIVYLDEPSAGVDPASRRFLWDVLEERRGKRTTILTTHALEEAEAMCSRIGIMVNGRFQCLGSPQHLKGKFGSGYELYIKFGSNKLSVPLETIVPEGAVLEEKYESHVKYSIPKHKFSLASAFRQLQDLAVRGEIKDYGISQATLEQVFIKFAKAQKEMED